MNHNGSKGANGKFKICPECEERFCRTRRGWVNLLGEDVKANICPRCDVPLFYKRVNGHVDAVLMEDKVLVDLVVARINQNLCELSDFKFDLGEATNRERKFAYDLIPWIINFLNGAEADLGMSVHEFFLGFIDNLIKDDWWGMHLDSLLKISNCKSSLVWEYWEKEARLRGVETPRSAITKRRLRQLAAKMESDISVLS